MLFFWHTERFIMFSVITNIYNMKTRGPALMELLTATGKLKKVFFYYFFLFFIFYLQLEMFDMCTTGDTAHIDTIFKFFPHTRVNMGALCLHRHPVSVNCLYHARMVLSVVGSFAYFERNALCKVTTDLFVWYSNTQNDFFPGMVIFSLHTLSSPTGRNVNCDEKQLTGKKFLSSFYL